MILVGWLLGYMHVSHGLFLSSVLGYSQKNQTRGVLMKYILFCKSLEIYAFVTLSLKIKLSPLEISQNCDTFLQDQISNTHGKST